MVSMPPPRNLAAAFDVVRRTCDAHASAIYALERECRADAALLAEDRQALQDDRAAMMQKVDEKLARGEADLEDQRAAVERDRAELDDEEARMRAAIPSPDCVVKLNVGGARFETSRAVLTKVEDSMLGRMFGRCDVMLQPHPDDGSIFIDRDGERFGVILGFLRDLDGSHTQRAIRALPEAAQEAMMQELDYFGLEDAVFGAWLWIDGAAFRPGPEMKEGRTECAAVFAGGRVVVFGAGDSGQALNALLDARTIAVAPEPDLLAGWQGCAVVQIDADRVLVAGGADNYGQCLKQTQVLHLSTLKVEPGPQMASARCWSAAVALDAHRILVVGGCGDAGVESASTEVLSLDNMTFTHGPDMLIGRSGCAAVSLDEFRVMVVGGSDPDAGLSTEILDVRTMAFTPGPAMRSARWECATVSIDAGHLLVIGGQDASGAASATSEVLDVLKMAFAPGPTMQVGRSGCAAVFLDDPQGPRILVIGGGDEESDISTTEVLEARRI